MAHICCLDSMRNNHLEIVEYCPNRKEGNRVLVAPQKQVPFFMKMLRIVALLRRSWRGKFQEFSGDKLGGPPL